MADSSCLNNSEFLTIGIFKKLDNNVKPVAIEKKPMIGSVFLGKVPLLIKYGTNQITIINNNKIPEGAPTVLDPDIFITNGILVIGNNISNKYQPHS